MKTQRLPLQGTCMGRFGWRMTPSSCLSLMGLWILNQNKPVCLEIGCWRAFNYNLISSLSRIKLEER